MNEPATKQDLGEATGVLRGEMKAMEARLRDDLGGEMKAMEARLRDDLGGEMKAMEARLRDEMKAVKAELIGELGKFASHVANVVIEQLGRQVSAVDDKYRDLPPRYDKLRANFDTHVADLSVHVRRPVASPKRTRRRPSR